MNRSLVIVAALLAHAGAAGAQERTSAAAPDVAALLAAPRAAAPSLLSGHALSEMAPRQAAARSVVRRSLHLVGGAVIGAGIGFLASQVVYSDWNKANDHAFADRRMTYALSGAVLGLAGGALVSSEGPAGFPGGFSDAPPTRTGNARLLITRMEIEETVANTALELVQSLRPEWLQVRGVQRFREVGTLNEGTADRQLIVTPGDATIIVYMDNARLGGLETLRQIAAPSIRHVQFLDAAAAQYRYGRGHTHGAIVVTTEMSAP